MLKLQRIYASESGPWDQTTGSKQMTFNISLNGVADFSRSYVLLRTTLAMGAHPTNPCVRMPSFGYVNTGSNPALPVAYSAASMIRDVRLDTSKQGTLEAIAFNNYRVGALRPYNVSVAQNRTRNVFGEGWSPLIAADGFNSYCNDGNYDSAWLLAERTGTSTSQLVPSLGMVVPLSDLLSLGAATEVDLSALGDVSITCQIDEQATLANVFARQAGLGYNSYNYTYVDATHITVDASARNADGECPFWVGMGITKQVGPVQANVTGIAIDANTGVITLTINADFTANGTIFERTINAAETVTWSVTQASLVLATLPASKTKATSQVYPTWVDIPYNPNTSTLVSNSFSLPVGTVAAFWVNSIPPLVTSSMNAIVRARFALNNVDLTNRPMQTYPASALYHDQLALALKRCGIKLASLDQDEFTVLPACMLPEPSKQGDQLLLSIDLTANQPAGRCHLFCLVERVAML